MGFESNFVDGLAFTQSLRLGADRSPSLSNVFHGELQSGNTC